jgi:hypothetical protein
MNREYESKLMAITGAKTVPVRDGQPRQGFEEID